MKKSDIRKVYDRIVMFDGCLLDTMPGWAG